MPTPLELITRLTTTVPIVIFSKTTCMYSSRAKDLLLHHPRLLPHLAAQQQAPVIHIMELNQRKDGHQIQQELYRMTGQSTVPSIWIGGKLVGGSDEARREERGGRLGKRIAVALEQQQHAKEVEAMG